MARNIDSKKGMTEGLFSTSRGAEHPAITETDLTPSHKAREMKEESKKVGRPRDGDLQDDEIIKSTTIQLTDRTIYKLDAYLLDNKPKTRSQVIRELIRKHL